MLETPTGEVSAPGTELEIACQIMAILAEGHDWVRLFSEGRQYSTQWTVLERNEQGRPLQIGSAEFDGQMGVITCG